MQQSIAHIALMVRDYDEALAFYVGKLGFRVLEDTRQPEQNKRWVVITPPGSSGASLLLARASRPEQEAFVGNQTGGRVFLFLQTDDFWRDYDRMISADVRFVRPPSEETYGIVAVFEDLYGTLWDLVQYRQDVSSEQPAAEVANVGLVRPPFVYLGSIGLGLLAYWLWPVQLLPGSVNVPIGVLAVIVAGALFVSAARTFQRAGTPVPSNQPTTTIVRSGPYGFSRNPIYLAFTLFQVGLAAWVNNLGVLLTLIPALTLMSLVVIPREERYLEARFPSEYLPYKRAVRRWL